MILNPSYYEFIENMYDYFIHGDTIIIFLRQENVFLLSI